MFRELWDYTSGFQWITLTLLLQLCGDTICDSMYSGPTLPPSVPSTSSSTDSSSEPLQDYTEYERDCPTQHTAFLSLQHAVMWGAPHRALRTLPPELYVAPSRLPDAGLGVFTHTFIPRYTWLGEYEGEVLAPNLEDYISWYTWTAHRDGEVAYYIDGGNIETSSYLRFINSPNRDVDENVMVCECRGRVYYLTMKDLPPEAELLVFYGEEYLQALGIDMDAYYVKGKT